MFRYICSSVILFLGLAIGLTGGLLGFLFFPDFLIESIKESVRLVEGSDAWGRWEVLPLPVVYKMYFFNVSNPDEVGEGATPIVNEVGPYIYNQYRTKNNIYREDNEDILSYYQHMHFEFDPVASAPLDQFDEITIVNVPLMLTILVTEQMPTSLINPLTALNSVIPSLFSNPTNLFLKTTPQDILFEGVYIMCNNTIFLFKTVCSNMEDAAPPTMPRLEDGRFKFTLFGHKNDTHDGLHSIVSGIEDVSQLGEIVAWEGSDTLSTWPETNNGTCNNIFGTDSSIFPPFRTNESEVAIFQTDICRSVRVKYYKETEYAGISALRYVPSDNFLYSPSNNSENECFCVNKTEGIRGDDGCLLDGAMELYDCLEGPLVLSLPHFYQAHETYKNGIIGLEPSESLHGMFLDLEPNSGTLLRGSKRVQFNLFIKSVDKITLTTNVATTLMPILWIDEGIELNDELIDMLNRELFTPMIVVDLIPWASIILGALLFAAGFIWLVLSLPFIGAKKKK